MEAKPIAVFEQLPHAPYGVDRAGLHACAEAAESAFLCIIQTFVEWLGGIREFFKLDRDCFQLDRIRLELFSPFS